MNRKTKSSNLDATIARVIGESKANTHLPYAKDVSRWIKSALKELGHGDKAVQWQLNDDLGRGFGRAVALAKYIEVMDMRFFIRLEFGPMFFENTTGPAQRKEIVYHEIAHVVDCWNGSKKLGHGKSWKALMKTFGLPPKTCYALEG